MFVAHQLGYRRVADLRHELSHLEYVYWLVYFGRRKQDQEMAGWKR